jgi:tetratricopeptide (TPR) repeat protein
MGADRVPRAALASAAAGLAVLAVLHLARLASDREEIAQAARDLELTDAALARTLRMTDDPEAGRVALARALLVQALEERAPERRMQRLEEAGRLAEEVLARRPVSWEAAMVTGASTYLRWSIERDPRLLQEYHAWEDPLLLARRLAPGKEEPERYLATAYLELWPALSDAKRDLTRSLLATAFRDPRTFERLIDPWLDVSGGELEPVPDAPWAWEGLAQALARRGDWPGYCEAWEMRRSALEDHLRHRLVEALDMVAGDRLLAARLELFGIAADAPRDHRFAPLVDQALRAAPFGPAPGDAIDPLVEWLRWTQDVASRESLPLSPTAVARLRGAVVARGPAGSQAGALAAWAAVALGDLPRAERMERAAQESWSEAWAPYRIEKARALTQRQRFDEAAETLEQVHPQWHDSPACLRARLELATALGRSEEVARLRGALSALTATSWRATEWFWRQGAARLEPSVAAPAPGLAMGVLEAPDGGAAVEVWWDGSAVACRAVATGREIDLGLPVTPGQHLLEVRSLAGGVVRPGAVTMLAAPPRPPRLQPGSQE